MTSPLLQISSLELLNVSTEMLTTFQYCGWVDKEATLPETSYAPVRGMLGGGKGLMCSSTAVLQHCHMHRSTHCTSTLPHAPQYSL